jgi:hypothetical protein
MNKLPELEGKHLAEADRHVEDATARIAVVREYIADRERDG